MPMGLIICLKVNDENYHNDQAQLFTRHLIFLIIVHNIPNNNIFLNKLDQKNVTKEKSRVLLQC